MTGSECCRPARPSDAQAIAALHLDVWRETYGRIAPPEAIAALDGARRLGYWQRTLGKADNDATTILAELDGALAGFVSYGAPGDPVFAGRGEVRHLYVSAAQQGRGIGRRLLTVAFHGLRSAGYADCGLAVVSANTAARAFYGRMGGTEGVAYRDAGPIWRSENILVTWSLQPETL